MELDIKAREFSFQANKVLINNDLKLKDNNKYEKRTIKRPNI